MRVQRYADQESAAEIRASIKAAHGHCPCVLEQFRCEDTLCMCKDFRDSPKGTVCNCGLYIKIED